MIYLIDVNKLTTNEVFKFDETIKKGTRKK